MNETTTTPAENARRITFLLNRLTVLRTLAHGARREAYGTLRRRRFGGRHLRRGAVPFHDRALLDQPTRRVTGDIFKDFLFSEILESSNRFSLMASAGHSDPPVLLAMEKDLRILQELFSLPAPP